MGSAISSSAVPKIHPPSVDRLARSIAGSGLPHPICVDLARQAIAASDPDSAARRADDFVRTLLGPVVNATGVLLHTNLGRAPVGITLSEQPMNVEFDLATGERGSRQAGVGKLLATLCGAEAAMVVNNNAAAVMLVLAAMAYDRQVLVSRGESVEIGGAFRVPDVMEQSGATLVDVGTTNRTRLSDYSKALNRKNANVALALKVHPSNYRVEGFVEDTPVRELATLGIPIVADIGSGLVDATCPWLNGPPPAWLANEPAAKQTLEDGAALIMFSGDKLFGGPQSGIIAGKADLIAVCARHPLARALRPGGMVIAALQDTALAYLRKDAAQTIPFWRMVATPMTELHRRAAVVCAAVGAGNAEEMLSLPGAGSAPGVTMASIGVSFGGDHLAALRAQPIPVIARVRDGRTLLDLRSVDPSDDAIVVQALRTALATS